MKKQVTRRSSPKKGRAVPSSRIFKLVHRRHTGHFLPRHHTSFPMLGMMVLSLGVLIASWPGFISAASGDYSVRATVLGVAPTQPATIDTPAEGTVFKEVPITVQGLCPQDTYVVLYRNGAFSGVTNCDSGGHYSLQTDLFKGGNQLQTRVFNHADVPGPYSAIVNVSYAMPIVSPSVPAATNPPVSTPPKNVTPANSAAPFIIKTNYEYRGYYTGQLGSWQIALDGGNAPYAVSVSWGDGTQELISRPKAGPFNLEHVYKKAGTYQGSYTQHISASDSAGNKTSLQLLAVINDAPVGAATARHIGTNGVGFTVPEYLRGLLQYVWPAYGIVVIMFICFWLGERREYEILKPAHRRHRHA